MLELIGRTACSFAAIAGGLEDEAGPFRHSVLFAATVGGSENHVDRHEKGQFADIASLGYVGLGVRLQSSFPAMSVA